MSKPVKFRGGKNVAMKVPSHQFDSTVESYIAMEIPIIHRSETSTTFEFGPINLHIDSVTNMSQAEIWLEFISSDANLAEEITAKAGFSRCDSIEALPEGYKGFWVSSPASIVHLISENE